jgi:hypothetical protein
VEDNCNKEAKVAEEARLAYGDSGRDCKQGIHINERHEDELTCEYSASKQAANNLDTVAFGEKEKETYELAMKLTVTSLNATQIRNI